MYSFVSGLTVRQLKAILKDWPEEHEDGEPTEVWIATGDGHSNQVSLVMPLDKREDRADIILERDWEM